MVASLLGVTPLPAQAFLAGTVSDTLGRRLEGADIVFRSGTTARTTARGTFFLGGIIAGAQVVLVRHPGHVPVTVELPFKAGDTLTVDFEMSPAVQVLPEVVSRAPAAESRFMRITGFDERRLHNVGGRFFTAGQLREREHSTLADLLRIIPGIRLVFHKGAIALATLRPANAGGTITWGDRWPNACYSQIYLDGSVLWFRGQNGSAPYNILQHRLHDLEAIEYYQASETPVQFSGSNAACGTLLLWTRQR